MAEELEPIRNKKEHAFALKEASAFFDAEPAQGSEKADRFEMLLMRIKAYESEHYAISLPDPIEAIKFRTEQANLKPKA